MDASMAAERKVTAAPPRDWLSRLEQKAMPKLSESVMKPRARPTTAGTRPQGATLFHDSCEIARGRHAFHVFVLARYAVIKSLDISCARADVTVLNVDHRIGGRNRCTKRVVTP